MFALNRDGGAPFYRQIAEAIRTQIQNGELQPGERLPTVRSLAKKLGVSPLTVYEAYSTLRFQGLVEAKVGSGSCVARRLSPQDARDYLQRAGNRGPVNIYEAISAEAGMRSLATNVPDPRLFPSDEFIAELESLRRDAGWAFYYAAPEGDPDLLAAIAAWLTSCGTPTDPSQLVVTLGGNHAVNLVIRTFCQPGDGVLVEGAEHLSGPDRWQVLHQNRRIVPRAYGDRPDIEGLSLGDEKVLYVMTTGCGTSGRVMEEADRRALLDMAKRTGRLVLEDASYAALCYGERPPDLSAMDSSVVQVGSFSYVLAPGLRLGYIRVPSERRAEIARTLQMELVSLPRHDQIALARFFSRGALKNHLERTIPRYRKRRDALLSSLRDHMPASVSWSRPMAGFACRLTFSKPINVGEAYNESVQQGVSFTPGRLLVDPTEWDTTIRTCFGTQDEASIQEAIPILAGVLKRYL